MKINSLNDVVNILSSSRHEYDGTSSYWWRIKASGEVLYGSFDVLSPSDDQSLRVVLFASNCPSRAACMTDGKISSAEWIAPMKPPFAAPLELPRIDREQLQRVKRLTNSVEIVLYNRRRYIHKYMDCLSQPCSFESEIMHHGRVHGTRFVPTLFGVVIYEGKNRGLLTEFIDGENLMELSSKFDQSQLYVITALILEAIADLEMRGYYPQDLKCANIVRRHRDGSLFVVDLGDGFSEGMHLREAVKASASVSILAKHMLYTLGRTLWELWIDDIPAVEETKEAPDGFPSLIRSLVDNCCLGGSFKTVAEVKEAYWSALRAMRRCL
jgi:serine/threonine protein kinase